MTGELAAVITEQHLGGATLEFQLVQGAHHIVALQALTNFDRHRLPRIDIDDSQRPEADPVLQLVRHEVHAPCLIWRGGLDLFFAQTSSLALASRLHTLQHQAFFLAQPVHQVLAYIPAFAIQQNADLAVSVAHSCLSDLTDTHPQFSSWIEAAPVAIRSARYTQN